MNRAVKPALFGTCALAVVGIGLRFLVFNTVRQVTQPTALYSPPAFTPPPAFKMMSSDEFALQQVPKDLAAIQDGVKREGVVGLTIDSPDGKSIRFGGTVSPLDRARLLMVAGEVVTTHRLYLFGHRTRLEWGVKVDPTLPQQLPPPAKPPELTAVDPTRPVGSPYFPLMPGMRRIYLRNAVISMHIDDDPPYSQSIGDEVKVAGKRCFPLRVRDRFQEVIQTDHFHQTNDGVYTVPSDGDLPPVFVIPYQYDPKHPRWDVETPNVRGTTMYMGERPLKVPAGRYTAACVWSHIEWKEGEYYRPPLDTIEWYAKGIGLVKRVVWSNGRHDDAELKWENVADTLRCCDQPAK